MAKIKSFKKEFTIKLGELSENIVTYKFKDPRDALKYLVKHIRVLPRQVIDGIFEYIELEGFYSHLFNPLETYYYLIMALQLDCRVGVVQPWFNSINEFSTIVEIENLYKHLENEMTLLNTVNRESHKFAVANTWGIWNESNSSKIRDELNTSEIAFNQKDIMRLAIDADNLFGNNYKGREVKEAFGFMLGRRIWRVRFHDDSWILAADHGNGWYYPLTDFNSYKLIEPFRF